MNSWADDFTALSIQQRSITSRLVAVFWQPSGMAGSSISWDEMWIFTDAIMGEADLGEGLPFLFAGKDAGKE